MKLHAGFCRVFSNATKLEILCLLRLGELTVNEIASKLWIPKVNTSQHLALMSMARILTTRRDGVNVHYGIANEKTCRACSLMQDGLEQLYGDASTTKSRAPGCGRRNSMTKIIKNVSIMCFHEERCQVYNALMTALSLLKEGSPRSRCSSVRAASMQSSPVTMTIRLPGLEA